MAGSRTKILSENFSPVPFYKATTTGIAEGSATNAVRLATESTKFSRFYVQAVNPAASALAKPTENTGNVYVLTDQNDLRTCVLMLGPGEGGELIPEGDLYDYWLASDEDAEGVIGATRPFVD